MNWSKTLEKFQLNKTKNKIRSNSVLLFLKQSLFKYDQNISYWKKKIIWRKIPLIDSSLLERNSFVLF